jgi:hypothetical protein
MSLSGGNGKQSVPGTCFADFIIKIDGAAWTAYSRGMHNPRRFHDWPVAGSVISGRDDRFHRGLCSFAFGCVR